MRTFTISHIIAEKETFYHRQLSKFPSTTVTIEVSLTNVGWNQQLNFYLFDNKEFKIERNCSIRDLVPAQLRNENFHIPLRTYGYKYITCQFENNTSSCHGKMTIQDFEPRNVGFSLGIICLKNHNPSFHLKGLTYSITLRDMSNRSQCLPLTSHLQNDCSKFYSYGTIPNLVGHQKSQRQGMITQVPTGY